MDIETIKQNVSVKPCFDGGANFRTHYLAKVRNGYAFKASIGAILFAGIFVVVGFYLLITGFQNLFTINENLKYFFNVLVGALFSVAGIYFLFYYLKPRVFNKHSNIFYAGYIVNKKNSTPLHKIVAIQLIGETITDDDGDYKSFELNLVLDDASRKNVTDHGNLSSLIDDAKTLSNYLNIPIWHAESNKT